MEERSSRIFNWVEPGNPWPLTVAGMHDELSVLIHGWYPSDAPASSRGRHCCSSVECAPSAN